MNLLTQRTAQRLTEAANRIFGNVVGNGLQSGRKVLSKALAGEKIAAWYPTPMQKIDPRYDDPTEKRRVLKLERLKRRGKGPPKKGHGKRASKGK
jgi:small subunit ribosomal protein S33